MKIYKNTIIIIGISCMIAMAGCRGGKAVSGGNGTKKYERKPIVETTDEKLKSEALLIDAKIQQEIGREKEAAEIYKIIMTRDPECDAAYYELSRVVATKGMVDSAIVLAKRAISINESNVWYQLHIASLYRHTNQKEAYIKTWEKIVAGHPEVLEYYYELSNAYLLNGDIKGAIGALNRVEKRVGITETVSLQKAKLWNHAGKEDKALQEIEALAKTLPKDSKYNGMLAESYMSAGQYAKAKECYDNVLAANPDDEYVHISLAEYWKAMKQPRKAYEELKIGMAQKNLSTTNKIQILTSFYSSEEFYGIHSGYAFDLMETIMKESDDSTTFAAFYGDVLMRQNKYAEAAEQFRLSIKADSSKYEVWEALLVSELSSDTDTALLGSHAKRAKKLFPLHPLPYYVEAVVEHDKGHYDEAIKLLKKCESIGFDRGYLEAEVYMLTAECYNRKNDQLCYGYYERYLKLRPDDPQALNSYAYRLAIDKKELEKAEAMSRKSLEKEPENPYYLDTYAWILHQMGRDKEAKKYIEKAIKRNDEENDEEVQEHYRIIMNSEQ